MSLDKLEIFKAHINQKRLEALESLSNLPIAVLIWGPDPSANTLVANCRKMVKETLERNGVYACYSEDLYDPSCPHSNFAQQIVQAKAFDLVISIPDSPGSIAEIHDFAIMPGISYKIIAFLDAQWNNGYANKSLLQMESTASCTVEVYDAADLPGCIINKSMKEVIRLREIFYSKGRR